MKIENKQRLRVALDLYNNAPCGAVSFRKDGTIYDVNQTLCTWLGYEKDELLEKRTLPSLFKIGGQIFFETHFYPMIAMQGYIKEIYFDILKKDKSTFHGLINVREIPAYKDNPVSYQATILDIADRRKYEVELLEAKRKAEADSKVKADILATISHEIRTPLNSILGIGNLLHQTPLNKNQQKYAHLLLHSSEHLLSLVNNLLDLSKIEANKLSLETAPFNILELISILKQTFAVKAKEKGIKLRTKVAKHIPPIIEGDQMKLKQVLTNLLGNSIKFTKKGAVELSVTLIEEKGDEICLQFIVKDSGIGIPKEKLESIFHEFEQASHDVSIEFGGTGLGLTISKKLLELQHSHLEVSSELNKGSTFSFAIWFTRSTEKSLAAENSPINEKDHTFEDLRVMVVDDNPSNIFIAEQYLDQWNTDYISVNSGKKAISHLKSYPADIVLLDLQMPELNGYDTARRIREMSLKKQPLIVAFSASTKGEVLKQLQESGIEEHLPKPFHPDELLSILLKFRNRKSSEGAGPDSRIRSRKKSTLHKTKQTPEIEVEENKSFNFSRFEKMANNNPKYLQKFKTSTLDAFREYKKEFNRAVGNSDVEALLALIHKSTMSIYYIQADRLTGLLNDCRDMLQLPDTDNKKLSGFTEVTNREFDIIIEGLDQ